MRWLQRRLRLRDNPFPEARPAGLDDLVFLPAKPLPPGHRIPTGKPAGSPGAWAIASISTSPFFVAGFDHCAREIREPVDRALAAVGAAYLGERRAGEQAPWLQLCTPGRDAPDPDAAAVVYRVGERWHPMPTARANPAQVLGLHLTSHRGLDEAITYAVERGFELLVLDGTGAQRREWPELAGARTFRCCGRPSPSFAASGKRR